MVAQTLLKEAEQQFLTINQVAEYFKISRRSVYTLMDQGLPYVKVGCHKRFALTSLHWWTAHQEYSTDPAIQAHLEERSATSKAQIEKPAKKWDAASKKRNQRKR